MISTARLDLREFTQADAPYIVAQLNDPGWLRFIGERNIRNQDDARGYIDAKLLAAYARHGFGLWAMQNRDTATIVGMCGLVQRDGLDDVDLGFALLAEHRGHGYAVEAARATLAHAHAALGLARVVAITAPENERSAHLLRGIGMQLERTIALSAHGGDSLLFSSVARVQA